MSEAVAVFMMSVSMNDVAMLFLTVCCCSALVEMGGDALSI